MMLDDYCLVSNWYAVSSFVLFPFGLWKVVELAVWVWNHVSVVVA